MADLKTLVEREMDRAGEPAFAFEHLDGLRVRRHRTKRVTATVVGLGLVLILSLVGASIYRSAPVPANPPDEPSVDLGIFEPVAGRIIYYTNSSLWAVDPSAPSPSTLVRLGLEGTPDADDRFASFTVPLGWSSDGTELLFMREDPTDETFPYDRHLFILHADGTETQVIPEPVGGAAISPDGSRVVFAAEGDGLYVVDAEGGQPVRIADEGESPTFSPDGTQIAYLSESGQSGLEHVWVANADGTDAHEILTDEALAMGMSGLTWSPAGDRIAIENQQEGHVAIYTFAPDGSDFTKIITGGFNANWSPDGSQIAYMLPYGDPLAAGRPLAIADADGSNIRVFDFGGVGPWHPGTLEEDAEAPTSPSPSTPSASPSPVAPGPEAAEILAAGSLESFAASRSGTVLTVWGTCHEFGEMDCGFAWRLGEGSQPQATGVAYPPRPVYDSGDVFVPIAAGDGFILAPPIGEEVGVRIAPDGTTSSISMACRDVSWSTPTEPGRLVWTVGLNFVDTVAGTICPTRRLGGRPLAQGAFTSDGTLWALVDNETGPHTLTIGRYDGTQWDYHDFATLSGSWTSVVAAAGSTVVVLLANPEPSPRPDQLAGFAVTTDAGATWSEAVDPDVLERDLPFSAVVSANDEDWYSGYTSMAFAGPSTLYVADGNGDLWRSTDFATFSPVSIPGAVYGLRSAGDAVIARTDNANDLVRISADGAVEPLTFR
jgi:hypothetical protein